MMTIVQTKAEKKRQAKDKLSDFKALLPTKAQ